MWIKQETWSGLSSGLVSSFILLPHWRWILWCLGNFFSMHSRENFLSLEQSYIPDICANRSICSRCLSAHIGGGKCQQWWHGMNLQPTLWLTCIISNWVGRPLGIYLSPTCLHTRGYLWPLEQTESHDKWASTFWRRRSVWLLSCSRRIRLSIIDIVLAWCYNHLNYNENTVIIWSVYDFAVHKYLSFRG